MAGCIGRARLYIPAQLTCRAQMASANFRVEAFGFDPLAAGGVLLGALCVFTAYSTAKKPREPFMFITPAYAQGAAGGDPFIGMIVPMLLMIVIFYFLLIRPQQQRAKQHREMVEKIKRGDTVVTSAGFIGKVIKVPADTDEVEVELNEQMRIRVVKSTLIDVRAKGEPVRETS